MQPTDPVATPSARTFGPTRGRRLLYLLIVASEASMVGLAGLLMVAAENRQAFEAGAFVAATALFLAVMTVPPVFVRIDFRPWRLDHRSLFGSRHVEIGDVISVDITSIKGTRHLRIGTGRLAISISEQTITKRELDDLVELVFAGAAATSNTRLHRTIPQKKPSGSAQPK